MSPSSKPKRRSKGGGAFKEIFMGAVMLIVLAGAVLSIGRANGIENFDDFFSYTKVLSTEFGDCASTLVGMNNEECPWRGSGSSGSNGSGGSTGTGGSDSSNSGNNNSDNDSSSNNGGSFGENGLGGNSETGESSFGGNFGNDYSLDYFAVLDDIEINDNTGNEDYDRTEWRHWIGSPCNTRQDVLIEQGENVQTGDRCRIESGTWLDPFTNESTGDSSSLDIDHIVPLGYANQHGGFAWDEERKEEFANDHINLRAVSASENRSKGADGPGDYLPPFEDYHCEYSQIWVETLFVYSLSTTSDDKNALRSGLETC